ncbi:hypothetical protein D3093_33920 (plasmid) [Azospirillum argentinense]|uniref:Uncharacterized protein n=1 Tax=Azospirillum argentinense TaxID=2970906 RepID=A0A4D8PWH1_9PROT|nr:hypothetical protein [Azospirillum argentinense]QCO00239.1 hypothetical protein D3093_33920 [Azospirillum argentinense]
MASMIASQDHRFPISAAEHAALIRGVPQGELVHTTFGPAGVNLIWGKGTPMPSAVRLLAEMRGVFAENAHGAGI